MARASAHAIGASQVRLASLTHIHLSRSPAPAADEENNNKRGSFHKYPSARKKPVKLSLEPAPVPQPAAPAEEMVPVPVATVAMQVLDSNGAAHEIEAVVHA